MKDEVRVNREQQRKLKDQMNIPDRAPIVKHDFKCKQCGKKLKPQFNFSNKILLGFGHSANNIVCTFRCAMKLVEYEFYGTAGVRNDFCRKFNSKK